VTAVQVGPAKNLGSVSGSDKGFLFSTRHPDGPSNPPRVLAG